MDELILEYRQSLKKVRMAIRKIERKKAPTEEDQVQMSLLRGMERDLLWSIEWMMVGHEPVKKRKIERLASYQREYPIDPSYFGYKIYPSFSHNRIDYEADRDWLKLDQALSRLTVREREVYVLSRGCSISYQEIATMLQVKKGTVQKMIERSERKLMKYRGG